jgi:hypothetical protein
MIARQLYRTSHPPNGGTQQQVGRPYVSHESSVSRLTNDLLDCQLRCGVPWHTGWSCRQEEAVPTRLTRVPFSHNCLVLPRTGQSGCGHDRKTFGDGLFHWTSVNWPQVLLSAGRKHEWGSKPIQAARGFAYWTMSSRVLSAQIDAMRLGGVCYLSPILVAALGCVL